MPKCWTCGGPLNVPGQPLTGDCGGDCVQCMADAGDPHCMYAVEDHRTTYHGMSESQVEELVLRWKDENAKYVPPGEWKVPDIPVWLEILQNSVRRA